ncbi:conserved hypothetical protein [Burkholderia latens]|uniref:hypothetical protein n=1 Tax=Burkholderia latens TaxID=488446 RepID=UPI0039A621ED
MTTRIQSLSPCADWFYVATGSRDEDIVFRVAAWAVLESGEVVGMIAASGAATDDNVARLVTPPPIKGGYKHIDTLTDAQKKCAALG